MIDLIDFHDDAALLTRCYARHALQPYIDSEINHILGILSDFNLSTYPVYLKIHLISLLFLLILKIRNHLLFALSTTNLFRSNAFNYNKFETELDIETTITDS